MENITIQYGDMTDYLKNEFEFNLKELDDTCYCELAKEYLKEKDRETEPIISVLSDFNDFYDYLYNQHERFIYDSWDDYYDFFKKDFDNLLESFIKQLPYKEPVFYIEGRHIGWRHQSGYSIKEIENFKDFIQSIAGDYDFHLTVTFNFDDHLIEVRLSHHDAPTGEFYTLYPIVEWVKENKFMSIFNDYSPKDIREILWYNFETEFTGKTREELKEQFLEEIPTIALADSMFKGFVNQLENFEIPCGVTA